MKIEKRWSNSTYLQSLISLYQSKMSDNVALADNILDGLTLNINDASCILKVIRNNGFTRRKRQRWGGHITFENAPIYQSTYYLAKIKKRSVKNYIVVKRKNETII